MSESASASSIESATPTAPAGVGVVAEPMITITTETGAATTQGEGEMAKPAPVASPLPASPFSLPGSPVIMPDITPITTAVTSSYLSPAASNSHSSASVSFLYGVSSSGSSSSASASGSDRPSPSLLASFSSSSAAADSQLFQIPTPVSANDTHLVIRRVEPTDYEKGHCALLAQLTQVGEISAESYGTRLRRMQSCGDTYTTLVIEDLSTSTIIASATLLIELKFVHGCGSVGHIEDVVVKDGYRGKNLGLKIVAALHEIARIKGCYKVHKQTQRKQTKRTPFFFHTRHTHSTLRIEY